MIQLGSIYFINPITFDSHEYLSISKNIYEKGEYSVINQNFDDFNKFAGESPTRMRQPVYPLFLTISYWLFGRSTFLVLIIQFFLNLITFLLIMKSTELIFRDKLFWGSKYLIAIYFPFWVLSAFILTESIFSFLLTLSIYLYTKAIVRKNTKLFFATGIILGITFLTRPIAIFILPILIIPLILIYNFKKVFQNWLIISSSFLLIISPWFIRNAIMIGDLTPFSSDGGYNLWCASLGVEFKPWIDNSEFKNLVGDGYYIDRTSDKNFFEEGKSNMLNNPTKAFSNGFLRILKTWTYFPGSRNFQENKYLFLFTTIIQILILMTSLIGIFSDNQKTLKIIFLTPAIGFTTVILFSYSISRFLIPAMPFVLSLSGQGLLYLINQSKIVNN